MPSCTVVPRPKLGNQPSSTEKISISAMPIRKVGNETPSSDAAIVSLASQCRRRSAVYTPRGMPIAIATSPATTASSSVAGSRSAINTDTSRPWRRLSPKSPVSARPTKRANWTGAGRSSPSAACNAARSAGVASWPIMLLTGSPTYWNSENDPIPTTSITSTA